MAFLCVILLVLLLIGLNQTFHKTRQDFSRIHETYHSRKVVDETEDVDFALLLIQQPDRLLLYCTTQVMGLLWNLVLLVLGLAALLWLQDRGSVLVWGVGTALTLLLLWMILSLRRFLWMANLYLFTRDRTEARKFREGQLPEIQQ